MVTCSTDFEGPGRLGCHGNIKRLESDSIQKKKKNLLTSAYTSAKRHCCELKGHFMGQLEFWCVCVCIFWRVFWFTICIYILVHVLCEFFCECVRCVFNDVFVRLGVLSMFLYLCKCRCLCIRDAAYGDDENDNAFQAPPTYLKKKKKNFYRVAGPASRRSSALTGLVAWRRIAARPVPLRCPRVG